MKDLKRIVFLLFLLSTTEFSFAQTLTDGPIQLQVRTRRINNTFNATDEGAFGIGFRPDELTYNVWARDNANWDGAGWLGGACLQANLNPPALSPDFNYLMLNNTYATANVPQFFDIRLNAWEDDRGSDGILGIGCGGTRCAFNGQQCCGVVLFGACIGFNEGDDNACFADPFRTQMNYRLGPPCQWYNHGFVTYNGSGCANNFYQPEIESFWRYTRGTSCANSIQLGTLTAGAGLSHFNSNICYSNNFTASPGNDVFYSFTVTQPTRIIASVCGASGAQFDSYLYVLNNACNSLASDDNGCGNQSTVTTKLCTPGTYYVVVDGATAPAQGTFTLNIQIDPSYNFSTTINRTNVTCNGANNGTATALPTGGATPYTYSWSNGGSIATINNLAPGNYTVTVVDVDGCSSTATTNITQPTALTATISGTNVTCSGANDGTATVTPSGGTPGYTYRWNSVPIQTTATAIFLQPTTYTVTVTDANSCTITRSTTLTTNSTINLSLVNLQNVTCNGQNNGAIDINVTGGFSPYTYTWSNTAVTQDLTGLAPGNYAVTVRDNSLCSVTASYTITQPPALAATVDNIINASCNGFANGSATMTVSGGTQPYSYSWSNGAVTQNLINVVAGNYTVTIRDANNCSLTRTANITQPPPLNANVVAVNPTCNGFSNGSIAITFSGGTPNYTYLWNTGAVTSSINNIPAGNYNVLITDVNGCFRNINTTLTQPQPLVVQNTSTNILCNGLNNGTITLNVSGGTPNYTYSWSNGLPANANQTNLSAGNYTVTVRDVNTCSVTQTFNIVQAPLLNASIVANTNVSCNGYSDGSIQTNVTGGTPPYTYLWNNNAATQSLVNIPAGNYVLTVTDANSCTASINATITEPAGVNVSANITNVSCNSFFDGSVVLNVLGGATPYAFSWSNGAVTQNLSNVGAGTYVVIITDANNCISTFTTTVTELQPVIATATITNILCNGNATGSINVTVSGGTNPTYTYQWSGGQVSEDLTNISAGNYTQTVTDGNGCSVVNNYIVTEPLALSAIISNTLNVSCNGLSNGSITTNITGGTLPYTYSWSNGATTSNLSNIPAGNYTLTVTDVNSCTTTVSTSITEPNVLTLQLNATNPLCFGDATGDINAAVNGGTTPYTYNWSNGSQTQNINNIGAGNYTLIVTDSNNCFTQQSVTITTPTALNVSGVVSNVTCNGNNSGSVNLTVSGGVTPYGFAWSNNTNAQNLSGVNGGSYTVTVTDVNGCSVVNNYIITQPLVIQSSIINSNNVSCNGLSNGNITTNTTGGTTPYTFNWSNSATTANLNNIPAGNYSLTVTDANGCTATANTVITEPNTLTLQLSSTNSLCFGTATGSVNAVVNGGTTPYNFNWNNGAITQDINNVAAGTYSLIVTDANNCFTQQNITLSSPPELLVSGTIADLSCNGNNSGAILINALGGVPNYTYSWSNGLPGIANQSNLAAANYTVTVSDANLCSVVASFTVSEPNQLTISVLQQEDVTCNGYTDGLIATATNGGTSPYNYAWNTGDISTSLYGVNGGTYSVTVTDFNSCTATLSATINEPAVLDFQFNATNVLCNGNATGSIITNVTGGNAPYNYQWNNNETTSSINNIPAGNYSLLVTDINNCFVQQSIVITEPTALSVTGTVTNVLCNADGSGAIDVAVSGGTTVYTYLWSGGQTSEDLANIAAGNYTQTVTDGNGCSVVNNYTVTEPTVLNVAINNTTNVSCNGLSNGSVATTISGGTLPFTYAWSNGATTANLINIPAGNYILTVTDANGCTATVSSTITEPAILTLQLTGNNPLCFAAATGNVNAVVNGGTTPYTYNWNNGATTQNISNVSAGNYSLVVTDANNCFVQQAIILISPTALNVIGSITNVSCNGNNLGAVTLNVSGGTTPYNYLWSNNTTVQNLTGVNGGNYTVTVTDGNGCSVVNSYTVTEPSVLNAVISNTTNVSCNGLSNGSIFTTISGGTLPYTYSWSNGSTTANLVNTSAGSYTVTVTDANGCTTTVNSTITEPNVLTLQLTGNNPLCFAATTGSVNAVINGGTTPYTYNWNNGTITQNISNVAEGNYSLIVTDANNCVAFESVTLTQPASLNVSANITNTSCGISVGGIDISATGGISPYTFLWSNSSTSEDIQNLSAGSYAVTITDVNGCSISVTFIVNNINGVAATISQTKDVTCAGYSDGYITTNITSGTFPFTYNWSNNISSSQNAFDLSGGTYSITISDANNCTIVLSAIINEPAPLALSVNAVSPQCNGGNNGSISVNVTGGTLPNTYLWSNGSVINNISGLSEGIYTVVITDLNGCVLQENIPLIANDNPQISFIKTDVLCGGDNSGAIDVTIVSGITPYLYSWSNGNVSQNLNNISAGNYRLTVTDANGCIDTSTIEIIEPIPTQLQVITLDNLCFGNDNGIAFAVITGGIPPYQYNWSTTISNTSEVATNLLSGNYSVTVLDNNNCSETASFTINEPNAMTLQTTGIINTTCYYSQDGRAILSVTGGSAPYEYSVSNNNYQNNNNFTNLSAGTYTAIALDANGCSATTSFTLNSPDAFSVVLPTAVTVFAGSNTTLTPELTGIDTSQVTFLWSPATYLSCTDCAMPVMTPKEEITYTVVITDAFGCSDTASILVFVRDDFEAHMPNIFSPNGDGVNDFYGPVDFGSIVRVEFRIFNRWGELVFYTNQPQQLWDGIYKSKMAAEGVYVYTIMGTFLNNEAFKKKGTFTLVR
jgi:gliding motility-associated-like protein